MINESVVVLFFLSFNLYRLESSNKDWSQRFDSVGLPPCSIQRKSNAERHSKVEQFWACFCVSTVSIWCVYMVWCVSISICRYTTLPIICFIVQISQTTNHICITIYDTCTLHTHTHSLTYRHRHTHANT